MGIMREREGGRENSQKDSSLMRNHRGFGELYIGLPVGTIRSGPRPIFGSFGVSDSAHSKNIKMK